MLLLIAALWGGLGGGPNPSRAQYTISEFIDASGDGASHILGSPVAIAVDRIGIAYVPGGVSSDVLKITPSAEITESIDISRFFTIRPPCNLLDVKPAFTPSGFDLLRISAH